MQIYLIVFLEGHYFLDIQYFATTEKNNAISPSRVVPIRDQRLNMQILQKYINCAIDVFFFLRLLTISTTEQPVRKISKLLTAQV